MVNGMVLIGIMLFYLHTQIKTSGIMDISSIINDIASKLSGTNALIQIQVNDKYYTKMVGMILLLNILYVPCLLFQHYTSLVFRRVFMFQTT